jgi:hypothetical protein
MGEELDHLPALAPCRILAPYAALSRPDRENPGS